MKLQDRVAVITGGGSGIGRASANLFSREGAAVIVSDVDRSGGEETVAAIRSLGANAVFVPCDVSQERDVENLIQTAMKRFGRLDILFNNAGIGVTAFITEHTVEDWDRVVNVDMKGVFLGIKHASKVMIDNGGGVIVNTASIAGVEGAMLRAAYASAKAGVISMTRSLALELSSFNIRVNCICPGVIDTPLFRKAMEAMPFDDLHAFIQKQIPLGRFGTPEEVAKVALFLASDDSAYVTGVSLLVDGGMGAGKKPAF